jgi:hypothetical protein
MWELQAVIVHKPIRFETAKYYASSYIPENKTFYRETESSYRFRNIPKQNFTEFRTKQISPKISLIYGKLKI